MSYTFQLTILSICLYPILADDHDHDRDDGISSKFRWPALITSSLLAAGYVAVFGFAVVALRSSRWPHTDMIKNFARLACITSFFRALYLGIPNAVFREGEAPTNTSPDTQSLSFWLQLTQFLLFIIPNCTAYGMYGLLVYYWSQAWYALRRQPASEHPWRAFALLLALFILLQCVLVSLVFFVPFYTVIVVHGCALIGVSLVMAMTFAFLCWRLHSALQPASYTNTPLLRPSASTLAADRERHAKLRKILAVAVACAGSQLLRAGVTVVEVDLAARDVDFPVGFWPAIITLYYTLSEILPVTAVLLLLRKSQPRSLNSSGGNQHHLVGTHHALGVPPSSPNLTRASSRTPRKSRTGSMASATGPGVESAMYPTGRRIPSNTASTSYSSNWQHSAQAGMYAASPPSEGPAGSLDAPGLVSSGSRSGGGFDRMLPRPGQHTMGFSEFYEPAPASNPFVYGVQPKHGYR